MTRGNVAVLGAGVAGRAASKLLADRGFEVTIFDQKASATEGEDGSVRLLVDPSARSLAESVVALEPEFVVASPGIPPTSPLVSIPAEQGLEVFGEVELAWRFSCGNDPRWLAVTGTNGKTTTVGMTEAILRAAGVDAIQAGNVGYPITTAASEDHRALVAELSSFQLATAYTLEPWASICLNVDSDHLDWHGSARAYRQAKGRVYDRTQAARLFFVDDPVTAAMAANAEDAGGSLLVPLTFGPVPQGAVGVDGGVLFDRAFAGGEGVDLGEVPLLRGALAGSGTAGPLVRDALAAAALALSVGVTGEDVLAGLRGFAVAPHRFAVVAQADGVTWVDDSKATNGHAAVAALSNVPKGRAVWIVGGDTKGQSLRGTVERVADTIRGAVVIGADQRSLLRDFSQVAPEVPVISVPGAGAPSSWMGEVVRACQALARPGDTVLLAPACASWDQFESYGERGDIFAQAVLDTV